MSQDEGVELPWWEPHPLIVEPIKVQGLTIHPGERVVVLTDEGDYVMRYKGRAPADPAHCAITTIHDGSPWPTGYWMRGEPGTGPGMWPGPYPMDRLRHPNILEGLARELGD